MATAAPPPEQWQCPSPRCASTLARPLSVWRRDPPPCPACGLTMLDEREAAAWRARITAAAPTPTPTMTVTSNSLRIVPVGAALEADPVALLHARIANATPDEVDTLAEQLVDLGVRLVEAAERVRGRR